MTCDNTNFRKQVIKNTTIMNADVLKIMFSAC